MLEAGSLLSVIASPRRREILRLLWSGERTAGDIHAALADVTFGAISLQLRALRQAGLVEARYERRHRHYKVCKDALSPVRAILERMWDDSLGRLKLEAELEASRRGPRPGHGGRSHGGRSRARSGGGV